MRLHKTEKLPPKQRNTQQNEKATYSMGENIYKHISED